MASKPRIEIIELGTKAVQDWLVETGKASSKADVDLSSRYSDYLINLGELLTLFNFVTDQLTKAGAPLKLPMNWVNQQLNRSMLTSIEDLPGHSSTPSTGPIKDNED